MRFEQTITVPAPAAALWAAVADVERWPEQTASMTSVELLDGPLRLGARARVSQPKLPPAEWTVTELTEGEGFAWTSTAPGLRTVGDHRVTATGDAESTLTLAIDQRGPIGWLVGLAYRRLITRYIAMEAAGLSRAAQAAVR